MPYAGPVPGEGPTDLNCNSGAGRKLSEGSLNSIFLPELNFGFKLTPLRERNESVTLNVNSEGYNCEY